MNSNRLFPFRPMLFLTSALAFILVLAGGRAGAQASHTTFVSGVDVTLSLDKTKIEVGEPLVLSIQMANVSDKPLIDMAASVQFPEGNGVRFEIQPPGELVYRYGGAMDPGTYPALPLQLVKGHPITMQLLILFDFKQPSGYVFPKAGTYEVTTEFSFTLMKGTDMYTATLPTTPIEVTEPTGINAEVLKAVNGPADIRSLHVGVIPTTGVLESLESLSTKYPKTNLGALALRTVGLHYVHRQPETREKGAALLTEYLRNGVVALDGDWVAYTIAGAYHLSGNLDLAREWIYYFMRTFHQSARLRPEDPLFNFYFFAPAQFADQVPWYMLKRPYVVPGAVPPDNLRPLDGAK